MCGIAGEDSPQEVCRFTVFGHAATGAVRDRYYAVDIGIRAENFGSEVGGDAPGDSGGAVDRGKNAYVIASGDATTGADNSLKARSF